MTLSRVTRYALAAALVAAVPALGSPASGAARTCAPAPVLRDVTLNQGLGSYTPLVRGKDTLVRLYLSKPSCAASTLTVQVTAASLSVTAGGAPAGTVATPTPALAPTFPSLVTYGAAPALDSPGDVTFRVPGTLLAPASTTQGFTAGFTASLSWRAVSGATTTTGTTSFSTRPGGGAISAPVDRRTNALRILVVPMGDARQGYASQFSPAAQQVTQNAMSTIARMFPVPSGVGPLTGSGGGLRYAIDPTIMDISDLMQSPVPGKFCGGGGTQYGAVSSRLAQFLLSWNTANPGATADRVLGVVDGAISASDNQGCALGWSMLNTNQGWFRADPQTTPQTAGAVAAMELAHSLGLEPPSRADALNPGHSALIQADATAPNRAYDLASTRYLNDDHTTMHVYGTWGDATTVLEQLDFADLRCRLGGAVTTDCLTTGTVGTATGVGAGPTFTISGTTDGTPAGTTVTQSSFNAGAPLSPPVTDDGYRLVQLQGSTELRTDNVEVAFRQLVHEADEADAGGSDLGTVDEGSFAASVPFEGTAADTIQLVHDGQVLLTLRRSPEGRPVASPPRVSSGGRTNLSDTAEQVESHPAVSPEGRYVAWENEPWGGGSETLVVHDRKTGSTHEAANGVFQPAWAPDRTQIAYVNELGDVEAADILFNDGIYLSGLRLLYDSGEGSEPASHPTWSPDGTTVAFEVGGDLYSAPADRDDPYLPGPTTRLTTTGEAFWPSWSRTPGDERIAYQRSAEVGDQVRLLDPETLDDTILTEDGRTPAFADDGTVVYSAGGVVLAAPVSGDGATETVGDGRQPDRSSGVTVAVDASGSEDPDDIFELGAVATVSGSIDLDTTLNPQALRAELRVTCPDGTAYPVDVGIPLTVVDEHTATYETNLDRSLVCPGGVLSIVASDGFSPSDPVESGEQLPGEAHPPTAAIDRPLPGARFLQYDALVLTGSGYGTDRGRLPDASLSWELDGDPAGQGSPVALSPPAGGWAPGPHQVTLTVTDPDGQTSSTTHDVTVVGDADHDGVPTGSDPSDSTAGDASADCDGDGIPNVDEVALGTSPCASRATTYAARVDVAPDHLPLDASTDPVTALVAIPYRRALDAAPASVRISAVNGQPVDVRALSWKAVDTIGGAAVARFDRQAVIAAIRQVVGPGPAEGRVSITVSGSSRTTPTWTFDGLDTIHIKQG